MAYLTPQAALDYEGVNPLTVPWTRAVGKGHLVPLGDGTELVVAVAVATDTGAATVHLVPDDKRTWAVSKVVLPGRR
ncbi:MAG: hypothetical protein L0H26_09365 [Microlunatus sp.]|nr:hypothetical protein [Microlunatus sp.]